MSLLDSLRYRVRAAFRRRVFDDDLRSELDLWRELERQQRRSDGMSEEGAAITTGRELGNLTLLREELRAMSMLRVIDVTRQDVRYALRTLTRSPVFTVVALCSLGLGIGATTAVFSLMHALLFASLPVPRPQNLVQVRLTGERTVDQFPIAIFRELATTDPNQVGAALAAISHAVVHVRINGNEDFVVADLVSDRYFATLGVRPQRGRLIDVTDARTDPGVVISASFWRQYFASDPAAVGKTMMIDSTAFTVIGVAPDEFRGITVPGQFQLAIPLSMSSAAAPYRDGEDTRPVTIIARLPLHRSPRQFVSMVGATFRACCTSGLGRDAMAMAGRGASIDVRSIAQGVANAKDDVRAAYRRVLTLLMCGVGSLLLITCVNVGNLLLTRAAQRGREFAVRLSLGASRWRLVRQCLAESAVLCTAGGTLGVGVAAGALRGLTTRLSDATAAQLGPMIEFRATTAMLVFVAATSLACGMVFGVIPALRTTTTDVSQALRETNRSGRVDSGLRRAFVVVQIALSLVLVVAASLFARSLHSLRSDDLGFSSESVVAAGVDARNTIYQDRPLSPLFEQMLARLKALPGIRAASVSSYAPAFGGLNLISTVSVAGYVPTPGETGPQFDYVSSGFFETMGIRLVDGRSFSDDQAHGTAHVAVVNRAFVRRYFGSARVVGRQFEIPEDVTIVGVADDARFDGPASSPGPMIYLPFTQWPSDWQSHLVVAARAQDGVERSSELLRSVRRVISNEAPGIRVLRVSTLGAELDRVLERQRFAAGLSTVFGTLAVCLVAIGLYGVVAYLAVSRSREYGMRLALGAAPLAVLWLVLRESIVIAGIGVGIGLPIAFAAAQLSRSQLYGIRPVDPLVFAGSAGLLFVVGVGAALLPALRASRIDPAVTLRAE